MISKIANHLRAMHLYYHACHNLVKGSVFSQDHGTFASFYDQCEGDYDAAIERAINKEGEESAHLLTQLKEVFTKLKDKPCCGVKENKEYFKAGLVMEQELCKMIEDFVRAGVSVGVEQCLGNMADKSEIRQYLIAQRIK